MTVLLLGALLALLIVGMTFVGRIERGKHVEVKVSPETFRAVRWLLVGALAVQLIIVPWREHSVGVATVGLVDPFSTGPPLVRGYAPIFSPPVARATIETSRLLLQLAVTGGLLLLWLRVAKPEE